MTKEKLFCLSNGKIMGELIYRPKANKISFQYTQTWLTNSETHALSLGLPLTGQTWSGKHITNFLWGLLPDDPQTLKRWGKEYQVSHNNVFRLLWHRGEECAGNVQFIKPDDLPKFQKPLKYPRYREIPIADLDATLTNVVEAFRSNIPIGESDEGKFSLAGAQPKLALYYNEKSRTWGRPLGNTPTTHILKPQANTFEDFAINEHFCLTLARQVGLVTTESFVLSGVQTPTIVVRRYDRINRPGGLIRVHQEDVCQALGLHPDQKYENDGGPNALQILDLIRDTSSSPREDMTRFFYALVFNWIISGTDAHAKNYSFLIGAHNVVRLAPLYDLASNLYYQDRIHIKKQKLAMKIGGEYRTSRIGKHQWRKWISQLPPEVGASSALIGSLVAKVEKKLPSTTQELIRQNLNPSSVRKLAGLIEARCRELL